MEKFKISDIQELFTSDVERFHSLTLTHVTALLEQTSSPEEALAEALRQTHSLKGLAATVQARGLACLGADLEKLLEASGSWMQNDREKADEVFQFILDHQEDWFVMNQFTCMDMMPQAWDVYRGLRGIMEERWSGYLPPIEAGEEADSRSVRLADLELDSETDAVDTSMPDLDVKEAQNIASTAKSSAPKPLQVVPPILRRRKSTAAPEVAPEADAEREVKKAETPAPNANPAKPSPLQVIPPNLLRRKVTESSTASPARPKPLEVVPPILRRAEAKASDLNVTPTVPPAEVQAEQSLGNATLSNPEATAAPAQEAAISTSDVAPILRVAPPALKRRAKKTDAEKQSVVEAASAPVEPASSEQPAAEAVFAAMASFEPVTAEVEAPAAGSAEAFKPGADSDLLEMLGQEVGGYLADLSENLTALARNLADVAEWEKTRRLFHTIKGTAATFNLDAASVPAKAAEVRCIEAIENADSRTSEAFETCVQRALAVAKALRLPFDQQPLLAALENALAAAAKPETDELSTAAAFALDPEMAGFFIRDARDQIKVIEQAVLRWEKGEDSTEQVWAAQRGFHTIKGAGNSIGLTAVAQSVHEVEAYLESIAGAGASGSRALFAFLFGAVDQLRSYLGDLARNPTAPWRNDWSTALRLISQPVEQGAAGGSPGTPSFVRQTVVQQDFEDDESHTIRVEASRLYELVNLIGEMVIDRARLEKKIEQLTSLYGDLTERNNALSSSVQSFQQQFEFNLLQGQNTPGQGAIINGRSINPTIAGATGENDFSELEFDRYDQFNVLARSLVEVSHDIEQLNDEVASCLDSISGENVRFRQTSQSLQNKVTNLSLVPVNTLFPRLQRAFRDALDVEHKEADLVLQGGESLLDKVLIDKIYAPLLHLLRNAVSHGIEDAVSREKLKKPARGQVCFSATQMSNQIVIQIADDGSGVNGDAVRCRAVEKGWLAADAPALTTEQVLHFIFQPGFSTVAKVTSVSGRGIGLDVVRKEIENLNGSIELKYEANQGSIWTLRLPLTLSISEAILTDAGGTTFAFPLNFIESGLILDEPSTRDENGREMYQVGESSLPVVRLSKILHLAGDETSAKGVIVAVGDRRVIVVVDRVLARQEIVIKQLDSLTAQHPLLNGATIDVEGRVIPILNLPMLLKLGERADTGEVRPQIRVADRRSDQLRVLIVDDSLSVRKVQERMLTELGCKVATASDGLYALEKLREQEFDLIFTDLEMPRLNGYELISDLRGNPAWASIPVVVISSRGADKYITKAMNLGASTFLSKPFTQEQLQQLLRHYSKAAAALQLAV